MDIKLCRFCRKNYQGISNLCPKCVQELDRKYLILRNQLDEKPNCTIRELSQDTEVDERTILFLVREGRLMLKSASTDIKCIKCGTAIVSGKYCDACKNNIVQTLAHSSLEAKPAAGGRPLQPGAVRPQENDLRISGEKVQLHTRSKRK